MLKLPKEDEGKIIKDPVHGFMDLNKMQVDLLSQPELQRMAWVKQIGLGLLVYPGGHHTRLEHCLGTSYLCKKISEKLELPLQEKRLLEASGMLHDIGHPPFSHSIEDVMERDHMEATKDLVLGKERLVAEGSGEIPQILEKYGVNPVDVSKLITGEYDGNGYLQDIISSQMDADQLDYLSRDAHHTGVSYGLIETDWIINVMRIVDGRLSYLEKGVDGLEDCIIARDHMYSSVYCHKTTSIAEKMLLRAVERHIDEMGGSGGDVFWMTDGQLFEVLSRSNSFSEDIVKRLRTRRLYKQAYNVKDTDNSEDLAKVVDIGKRSEEQIEKELSEISDLDKDLIIVNRQNELTVELEPRLREFDIRIKKDDEVVPLEEISETVRSLKRKEPVKNIFSVYTPSEHRNDVHEAVREYLHG